ncbi:MAG: ATP-binding protein [Solirubrobacteraceae bacterium]
MQRLSIARSLRLALVGLTLVLAVIAALGVSSLYNARQRYENTLAQSSSVAAAGANLTTAAIARQEVLRDARGPAAAGARADASSTYADASATAIRLASADPRSERLLRAQLAVQARARVLMGAGPFASSALFGDALARSGVLANELQARQRAREAHARSQARSDSRHAITLVAVAGLLALLGALALISGLVRGMRRPLDALVDATRGLAAGELERRVDPAGPRELRDLGAAFNAMGADLGSARRRIEEERRRLSVTIESLGDALIVTEPSSSMIATINPRAAELVPELVVGSSVERGSSPLPPLASALRGETIVEHRGRALAVTAATLGSNADGVVWTVRDTSERAQLEHAKSEFVATASHELRSPLTSIKGFVELLAHSPERMSARQREFVDIILRSTDRLVELVNDLLDVARIEADHMEISRRPIDVGEAVREIVELTAPRIAQKRQQLTVLVAPRLPLAYADPGRVRQIVGNLLTNAHLYTGEGGAIQIGVDADRAWIRIAVGDSGSGITEEESRHIFERFHRGSGAGPASPGTGLGLSIVKSLVELHQGRIEIESEPGRGTTFRVLLPAAIPAPQPDRTLKAIRGRRVLVVDDEPEIAELLAGQLAPLQVSATIATSGKEALARLGAEHYDAVTLDILMPGMDGFQVLRALRADPELRRTPIVFVSVFSGRHELAGEWVVSKPIDPDELRQVLSAAVSAGRSRVLVVGREELRVGLAPALAELGIEHLWVASGAAAARACAERRYEVALVDIGIRNPQAVLQALDLRGRRLRRAVILFSDGATPGSAGIGRLGMEVVPADQAVPALLAALRGTG